MPKVVISDTKGLVQESGTGLVKRSDTITSLGTNNSVGTGTHGIHEVSVEVDLDGVAFTATDNGLVKTLLTFPENIRILQMAVICTETISSNNTAIVDIATTSQDNLAANTVVTTNVVAVIDGLDLKSSVTGTAGTMNTPAFSSTTAQFVVDGGASADKLVMMNKGTGNTAETKTSGKFLIYMKYLGAGPASLDTTV